MSLLKHNTILGLIRSLVGVLKKYIFEVHTGSYYNSEREMVSFPPDIHVLLWG